MVGRKVAYCGEDDRGFEHVTRYSDDSGVLGVLSTINIWSRVQFLPPDFRSIKNAKPKFKGDKLFLDTTWLCTKYCVAVGRTDVVCTGRCAAQMQGSVSVVWLWSFGE